MCLATVYKESDDSVIFKNVARIDVDGNKLVLRDIMGDERVVEGRILMVDLANSIVKPVSKVVKITQRISEGDYDTRFQEDICAKELHELAHAVNQMAESLEEQETMRKRLTSDVAHELRTPVANVSSYMEMMTSGTGCFLVRQ